MRTTRLRILDPETGDNDIVTTRDVSDLDEIAVAAAGFIAGNICGEPHRRDWVESCDWYKAVEAADHAYPDDDNAQRRLLKQGQRKAYALLRKRWPLVERVATELLRARELDEDAVAAILGEVRTV